MILLSSAVILMRLKKAISGLKLNKKKTKAMCFGSAKNNETKPLGFESYKEPIKSLGINLSYKHENNDNLNFFTKICKMDTKSIYGKQET